MVQGQRSGGSRPASGPSPSPRRQQQVQKNPELLVQNTHSDDVTSIAFSPDGRLLATGSWDATIMVRDVQSGRLLRLLGKHPGGVTSVAFSSDNGMLASGGLDNTVKVWNVQSGRLLRIIKAAGLVAFSPQKDLIACAAVNGRKIDSGDYTIRLINVLTGRIIHVLRGHNDQVSSLAFSPDGQTLISGNGPLKTAYETYKCEDRSVRLWNTVTGLPIPAVIRPNADEQERPLCDNSVRSLVFTPDGKMFAINVRSSNSSGPGQDSVRDVSLWEAQRGKLIRRLKGIHGATAFSPDGRMIASTGDGIKLWNLNSGDRIRTLTDSKDIGNNESEDDPLVVFSPDGKTLAATAPFGINIWDSSNGQLVRSLVWHVRSIGSVSFSADGQMFELKGRKGGAKVWDASSGAPVRSLEGSGISALGPDKKIFASVGEDKTTITIRDASSGKLIRNLAGPSAEVTSLNFRYDGKILAASYLKEGAARSDGGNEPATRIINVWDVETGGLIRSFKELDEFLVENWTVTFSPEGKTIASWGDSFSQVNLWNTENGKLVQQIPMDFCHSLTFSPNGKMLAAGGGISGGIGFGRPPPGLVQVWDLEKQRQLWFRDWQNEESETRAVAFSPDGSVLAVGDIVAGIKLLEARSGKFIRNLDGHAGTIRSLAFDPKNKTLTSVGGDSATKFWSIPTGELLATLIEFDNANWLVVAPDGLFDGTADAMQQVSWRTGKTEDIAPLDSFFNDFYYPSLLAEILEGNRPRAPVDIATALQLPGLRAMLGHGFAHIQKRMGKSILCFNERPTAAPQLFSDAQPLAFDIKDLTCDEADTACRCQKELPGDAQIELASGSATVKPVVPRLEYEGTKSEARTSTLHVQTIGVGNYNLASSGFKPLPSSVSGAKELTKFFVEQRSKSNKQYQDIRIWDGLYDEAATRQKIRQRLAEMGRQVKEDDVVFLFFSGHGVVPAGQEMFYFAPIDVRGPNPQDERETGLNTAMLAEAIREMPARRVVLIIDACQSGGAIESLGKIAEVKAKVEGRRALIARGQTGKEERRVGVYVIAAATPLQEAVQPKTGNGALVATLLEALGSEGPDGAVWMRELIKYVEHRLPEVSERIGQRHTPMIVSSGLDFPIAN